MEASLLTLQGAKSAKHQVANRVGVNLAGLFYFKARDDTEVNQSKLELRLIVVAHLVLLFGSIGVTSLHANVVWLNVSMNVVLFVQKHQRLRQLAHQIEHDARLVKG